MKLKIFTIFVVLFTFSIVKVQAQNILANNERGLECNGSFEDWTDGKPDCWFGEKTNIAASNIAQYSTSAQEGNFAVQLINPNTGHKRFTSQAISIVSGTTYSITFWARGQGDVRTGLFDDRTTSSGYFYNEYITVNATDWTEYTQTIAAENTTDVAEFIFSVRNTVEGNDHLQIDNVTISSGTATPQLTVSPSSLAFGDVTTGTTTSAKTVTVSGTNLTGNISYTKTGTDASSFTITETSWNVATGGTLSVTFTPTEERTYAANIVVSSTDADDKTITLSGTGISASAPPVAQFSANKTTVEIGKSVSFTDESTGSPTSWNWTFEGGTPATSTQQNPTVVYNTIGTYDVTLQVTNANGNDTETKTNYIEVVAQSPSLICNGSFETWTAEKPDCWFGSKTATTAFTVSKYSTSAQDGSFAVQLINATDSHKRFTSQAVSVTTGKTYSITFWVRGQGDIRTGLFDDRTTGNGYSSYNEYIIVNSTGWTEYTQTIAAENTTDVAEFIFSVRNTVEGNDHLQIDNVKIEETVGIGENTTDRVAVYPNPAKENIQFILDQQAIVSVIDLTGRTIVSEQFNAGLSNINVSNLANGLYIMNFRFADGTAASKKFSKK
ncbi:MAG: PKD domain-containing protein [Lentimicrobiaceae bacterium]|jgi:PKD repeat protein|nr:PKD domain-containing protein [Lentimicrobiaceae bacterium]